MIDELYINGQKADISETGISLTYKSTMFSELSKIVSNFSYTIKLPKTDNNIKLIEGAIFPSSASRFPYLVHSGTVLRDGIKIVDKANVVILSVSDEIELSLSWGTSTALSELINDGATLKDLGWTEYIYVGTPILGNEKTPIIDWGAQDDVYNVFNHPVIYAVNIFQKILEKYNVSIHLPSDLSAYINKIMIPLTSENSNEANNNFFSVYDYIQENGDSYYLGQTKIPLKLEADRNYPYFRVEKGVNDSDSSYIRYNDRGIDVDIEYDAFILDISKNIEFNINDITATLIIGSKRISASSFEQRGNYQGIITFNAGKVTTSLDCVFEIEINAGQEYAWGITNPERDYQIKYASRIKIIPHVDYLRNDAMYYYSDNMPDIKITDFIKTIKTMFGLYARVEDGEIYLEKYDSIYDFTQAEDWSDRLVYGITGKCDIDFHTDLAQRNTFTYKNDEVINPDYDGVIVINDMSLEQEKEAFKSDFEATHNTTYLGHWCAKIPIYSKNEDGEIEYDDVNPRILASAGQLPNNVVGTFDGLPWPKLISKYYQKYIDMMTDAKYVTVDMIITPLELKEVDLYKPIYLKQYGCYFAITEIKTGDNNICSVTLIKL